MKKIILTLLTLLAVAVAAGCLYGTARTLVDRTGRRTLKGSGHLTTRTFDAPRFDGVYASSTADVTIVKGSGPITVEADDNVMEYVAIRVEEGRLRIKLDTDQRYNSLNNVTFRVTVPTDGRLAELKASGAAKIVAEPVLTADEIEFDASGAAKLVAMVACETCEIDISGTSKAEIGGRIGTCAAEASGASKLKLVARTATCDLDASGASKIEAIGAAERCELSASGAAKIDASEFVVVDCQASASGSGKVSADCTRRLSARATGAGKVVYQSRENLHVTASKSGAGSVSER